MMHAIDIDGMLEGAEAPVTVECCIYKVPFDIRRLKAGAYTPKVVSIGPFHHNRHLRLQNMERHKLNYCKAFLQRTNTTSDTWIRYIEAVENNVRRCYSESLDFSEEELVKIIFVDSGFILELFCRTCEESWSSDDVYLSTPWLDSSIRQDLWLLENQLPFFLLHQLFNISFNRTPNDNLFVLLTVYYFGYYNSYSEGRFIHDINIRHFTDLLRTFHLQHPPQTRPPRTGEGQLVPHLPSASELSEAGVRFKVNKKSKCLLDVLFSGRILKIPQLKVEDRTEILFRNMVALEQCHYPYFSYITDYVIFLDFLVNTSKDVDILVQEGVLLNWLGDADSVANMFNGLCQNIVQPNVSWPYFYNARDLNAFCRNRWNIMLSTLRLDYCKTPWKTAATIGGIFLLFLSFVQTLCSVVQVIQQ
ncbi:hypothetical protein Fmac_000745 [Flemingia macrophylla]|uniref:Uncharacterized protein n=1 Tax=Flemingia macrophylla TaxID=520843 RepID=A0ABD1NHW8_9FABA